MRLFTTRNAHAALSFKQLIGRGKDTGRVGQGEEDGRKFVPGKKKNNNLINTQKKRQNVESVTL